MPLMMLKTTGDERRGIQTQVHFFSKSEGFGREVLWNQIPTWYLINPLLRPQRAPLGCLLAMQVLPSSYIITSHVLSSKCEKHRIECYIPEIKMPTSK